MSMKIFAVARSALAVVIISCWLLVRIPFQSAKPNWLKMAKVFVGDTGGSILLDDGRQLLMISDGMGSGEEAAAESSAAISLISRLLEAGFSQETAINMLQFCFITARQC